MRLRLPPTGVVMCALVGVLAGCTTSEPAPVPTVATAPFVCDGVPSAGVEAMLGEVTIETSGTWDRASVFACSIESLDHDHLGLLISEQPHGALAGVRDDDRELEVLLRQPEARQLSADAPGTGVLFGSDDPTAAWMCGGRELIVEFQTGGEGDRRVEDVERLLISMLPWACGEVPVPSASDGA